MKKKQFEVEKHWFMIYTWSEKAFTGAVVHRSLQSMEVHYNNLLLGLVQECFMRGRMGRRH